MLLIAAVAFLGGIVLGLISDRVERSFPQLLLAVALALENVMALKNGR
jgi:hypothetical protein